MICMGFMVWGLSANLSFLGGGGGMVCLWLYVCIIKNM